MCIIIVIAFTWCSFFGNFREYGEAAQERYRLTEPQ